MEVKESLTEEKGKAYVGNLDISANKAAELLMDKAKLGKMVDWATAFSLWPVHLTTSVADVSLPRHGAPDSMQKDMVHYHGLLHVKPTL